jgi:hypothetical protein
MASVIARIDAKPAGPTPARAGVTAGGDVKTRPVIDAADRPLLMWVHSLAPGASLRWDRPAQDHLIYVWEGRVLDGKQPIGLDEAFVVEHGGRGEVHAGAAPAVVLHFHRAEDHPDRPSRPGGHTHALTGGAVRRGLDDRAKVGRSLFADAACPTCEVWLHGNQLPPGLKADRHYHTDDEIIVVTGGEMMLGRLGYGRGSVLAIDAETRYAFKCGANGLSFVNFRAAPPVYVVADDSLPPQDGRALLLRGLARSRPVTETPPAVTAEAVRSTLTAARRR